MKFLDLIVRLTDPSTWDALLLDLGVDVASEHLSVYVRGAPGLEMDIVLLGVEETNEAMNYQKDGVDWTNFLPLYMVEEMVEGGVEAHKSPVEIATRVLEYARDDA